jgi:cytidine deaminase
MIEIPDSAIWVPTPEFMLKEADFIRQQIKEIGTEKIADTIDMAVRSREKAYTPYSHYNVGAGLLTVGLRVYGGSNSESVAYSPTNHAEGTAIAKANSEGEALVERKYIKALAVCHESDSGPCGECLQRTIEHADNCLIIIAKPDGKIRRITSLQAIFPYNFNPTHLGL